MADGDNDSARPSGFTAPYRGDIGSFAIRVNVGPDAPMDSLTEVVLGLQALTDVAKRWGAALARSAAMWDLTSDVDQRGPTNAPLLAEADESARLGHVDLSRLSRRWRRGYPFAWWAGDFPEFQYLSDVRATRLAGPPLRVTRLTYENPVELVLLGAGLTLTGAIMASRLVRDWSANRRIGLAEARKAEAEARVSESWAEREEAVTETITSWLGDEARRTATPLPLGEMAAITSLHNFPDLRRVIERQVTLELPPRLDPTATDETQ